MTPHGRARAGLPLAATVATLLALAAPAALAGAPTSPFESPFEVIVSLEADPQGDERDRYEEILVDFAGAVHEASEGAHRIGTIRVYTAASAHDVADVVWQRNGHPKSALNGIRGPGQIYMVDKFVGGGPGGEDLSLTNFDDAVIGEGAAGAVLAHEWAHYAYGLLDEHVVAAGDVAVVPSLMASPWSAGPAAGPNPDPDWLSFSIAGPGTGPFQDTGATAQHRRYGVAAWELLPRPYRLEDRLLAPVPGRVERVFFEASPLVAPVTVPVVQGGGPPPTIVWEVPCSSYVIAIDRSGSMTGQRLADARAAADLLLDFVPAERTYVTVVSFGDTGVVEMGPTLVSDRGTVGLTSRDRLHDAIQGIAATLTPTSFAAGLDTAIADSDVSGTPDAFEMCDENVAVFFFSDATNSPGDDVDGALLAYTTPPVTRIFPLDVSPLDPTATTNEMTPLAAATGGILMGPAIAFTQVQQAWRETDAPTRVQHQLERGAITIEPNGSSTAFTFTVDPSLDRFEVCATPSGAVGELFLSNPNGARVEAVAARNPDPGVPGDDCSWFFAQSPPSAFGEWTITGTDDEAAAADVAVALDALGQSDDASTTLRVWLSNDVAAGQPVPHPQPVFLSASLARDLPVAGARIDASIDGGTPVPLRDDGVPPDTTAGDGVYVGGLNADSDGLHDVEVVANNALGIAATSPDGLVLAPGLDGGFVEPEEGAPLGGPLTRIVELGVETAGAGAGPPVPLVDDLEPVDGRIEAVFETDLYEVDLAAIDALEGGPGDLEIRVSRALLGMQPRMRIYDGDPTGGAALLSQAEAAPNEGGLALPVQASDGTVFVEVAHAGAGTGSYQLSAGRILGLDFGQAGLGDSPCDQARTNKNDALRALEDGLEGAVAASVLITESRTLARRMDRAIRLDPSSPKREEKASKLLRASANRDTKALKRIEKAIRKNKSKELVGARRKIRNARKKLLNACRRLGDGGSALLP